MCHDFSSPVSLTFRSCHWDWVCHLNGRGSVPRQTLADFSTRVAAFSPGLTAVALPDLFFGGKKWACQKPTQIVCVFAWSLFSLPAVSQMLGNATERLPSGYEVTLCSQCSPNKLTVPKLFLVVWRKLLDKSNKNLLNTSDGLKLAMKYIHGG